MALLSSVTTPGLAYAHGRAHAHIAAEHAGPDQAAHDTADHGGHTDDHERHTSHGGGPAALDEVHDSAQSESHLERSSHDHAHAHPVLADATAPRHDAHVPGADIIAMPARSLGVSSPPVERIACAVVPTAALLARPGPDTGSPSSPRAPPAR